MREGIKRDGIRVVPYAKSPGSEHEASVGPVQSAAHIISLPREETMQSGII